MIKISYAVTVCDELEEIARLLSFLTSHKREEDEIAVLWDSTKGGERMQTLLNGYVNAGNIKLIVDKFEGHFADWKNKLTSHCSGDYIFQIDADELPNKEFLDLLPSILEQNPDVDVMLVPRINTVEGLTEKHIRMWGWRVENGRVNFPDYQWRIYKNVSYIRWVNRVHEKLHGYKRFSALPAEDLYALLHPKTIQKQEKQNNYYDTL